jgi:hypothetical protein
MIEIRICNFNEIDKLKEFINSNWMKGHILATNDELLKWQHYDAFSNQLNFILGYETITSEIVGILGFIPLNKFDDNLSANRDYWLVIWKVKEGLVGLGMELLNYLIDMYNPKSIGAIGINKVVKKLYKILKFKTGKLTQYYYLNPNTDYFKIAKVYVSSRKEKISRSIYKLRKLDSLENIPDFNNEFSPHKSYLYFKNRFCNHPVFEYMFYGLFLDDKVKCILITRKIAINNSSCIRIVDIYGSMPGGGSIEDELSRILEDEKSEYIDCLNYGIQQDLFLNLGFSTDKNNIIPNYFEPFAQLNVDIEFAYLSDTDYIIFKGDSDQDRPNVIKGTYEKQ